MKNCLHCKKKIFARGLCTSHYSSFHSAVVKGVVSWEGLVLSGNALDSKKKSLAKGILNI